MKYFLLLMLLFANAYAQDEEKDSAKYITRTIEVEALRGIDKLTPVTFENLERKDIEEKYWMQDFPMFLKGNTSINSYSESGSSIGYSYISIRGFDQRRIAILLNGVPQNDAEDHQVYWVDLSDITSSVENIQIQRGIGTALYGTSSIGGVINIQTLDYFKQKFINAYAGYGDYNSKRFSLEYSSGLTNDGFGFYAKFSRTKSDGYRELSWSDHWAYFISAGKYISKNAIVKFNIYGSPIKNHLAYYGITWDYLDGNITGDKLKDRRYNPLAYYDETDNYYQPHYEFVFNWQPTSSLYLSNTFSYIRGDGYFITSYPAAWGYDFSYFRLNPFYTFDSSTYNPLYYRRNPDGTLVYDPAKGYVVERSDMINKLYVNNDDFGWYPKLQWKHDNERGNLVIGGEMRLHKSDHYGEIASADVLPPGTVPNFQYYYYNGKKTTISAFANEIYSISKKLTVMAGIQFAYHQYKIENHKYSPYNFSVSYNFLTPRAGVNYNFTERFRVFGNFSIAKREPRIKDIYNAENPYARPNFRIADTVNNIYEDPLVRPETMYNFEIGFGYTSESFEGSLNLYTMNFNDEIVSNGQLDNVGQPISGNAGKSIHRGIEFDFTLKPFKHKLFEPLTLSGNLNLSDNFFKEFREVNGVDSAGNIIYGNDYTDNKILLTPDLIGNLILNYNSPAGINVFISMNSVGKQYLDNSENERKNRVIMELPGYVNKIIEAYSVFNAGFSADLIKLFKVRNYTIKSAELRLMVNNIFDVLYETTGNVDWSGTPYWIPAATRNFWIDIKIGL